MGVKYIFVTGGVVSGLGKGITAASLGRLLKNRGYKFILNFYANYTLLFLKIKTFFIIFYLSKYSFQLSSLFVKCSPLYLN